MGRVARSPVATLAATTTAGYGVLFYAYGVLLGPMRHGTGWSRSFLSGTFSLALVVAAAVAVPVGRWLDRHPPRRLFLTGSVAGSLLVAAWSVTTSRALYVAVWALLGLCQAVLFYDPAFTVLTKWFDARSRARAITSVTLVAGLASTIFGPLTAFLEHALGWRHAVLALGGLLAVVTVPSFAFGLRPPAPSAVPAPPARPAPEPVAADAASTLPADAFRTRSFWLLTAAYLLSALTTYAVPVHLVSFLNGRGVGTGLAATVLGAVGLVQVLGRGTFIRLSAKRPSVQLATGVLATKAAGLALLVALPGRSGIVPFVVVYGAANGVSTLTRATTLAELYGPDHYGAISSVMGSISAFAGALAPFAAAAAIDAVGGVGPVFAGLVGVSLLAAAGNEVVARPSRRVAAVDPGLAPIEP